VNHYSFADVGRQQALKLVAALSQEYSVKELVRSSAFAGVWFTTIANARNNRIRRELPYSEGWPSYTVLGGAQPEQERCLYCFAAALGVTRPGD
jgi:hypothetical protein